METLVIRRLQQADEQALQQLSEVLLDCVEGGASVGFMQPLAPAQALAFWRGVAEGAQRGGRVLLVATLGARIVGTVQLILAQPDNQPHRADLSKMLVHRDARERGVGAALLRAAHQAAQDNGRTLLVLDTASDSAARLYAREGWRACGTVPGYALLPQGGLCDTHFFYRHIAPTGTP